MKTRRERFEEIATRRVKFILQKLDNLSNCANTNNYEYTEEDVKKMFSAINAAVKHTKAKFDDGLKSKSVKDFKF